MRVVETAMTLEMCLRIYEVDWATMWCQRSRKRTTQNTHIQARGERLHGEGTAFVCRYCRGKPESYTSIPLTGKNTK